MTYSGGQRGKARPRSERESPLQSLFGMMLPSGTGRPSMDRRTARRKAVATEQMTPLERAPVGTPMILGGELGYKGVKQSGEFKGAPMWIRRQDMESENIPIYDRAKQQYIYDVQPLNAGVTPIVTGLTPTGEVDRSQSDEYKATRARYDQLRKAGPEMVMTPEGLREKAVDYGLQEWAKMYPQLAAKQEAAKYGTFNPLMQQTFDYQTGEAPDQVQRQMMIGGQRYDVDPEAIQYQIDQQRAAEMGSPNPLVQQEMQQEATAAQANQGMEETESVLKKTDAFLNPYYNRMF